MRIDWEMIEYWKWSVRMIEVWCNGSCTATRIDLPSESTFVSFVSLVWGRAGTWRAPRPHGTRAKALSSQIGPDVGSLVLSSGFAGPTCHRRGKMTKLRQEHAETGCGCHERGVRGVHWPLASMPVSLDDSDMD